MKQLIFGLLLTITSFVSAQTDTQDIIVNISNFDSNEGKIMVALYDSEDTFLKTVKKGMIGVIENKTSTVTFKNIPDGIYAISVFHDEDNNGKLETNFLGIPKEDTGTSNNAPARFGPPKWEDAKFIIKGKSITLNIKL
ncbi:DUF2141 domain-containing protein [Jejuia spongiicola]|uniref:DUF2141 domain-containing protein n=1 Tax=Jejuia spongiicola TaxID=2942207 RepID=A0ABT0QBJ1_9FLAO|nr:DUF2141 domain-containing protein [Jejuia spongiicola]MCL6294346.1 DUF2141 domain-containing protein [Jejuia spongiicola]